MKMDIKNDRAKNPSRGFAEKITQDTMIPLYFLVVIVGGVFWLSNMYAGIESAKADIASMKKNMEKDEDQKAEVKSMIWQNQTSIDRRLTKIEGQIEYIVKQIEKK